MADQAAASVKEDEYELGNTDYVIETPDKPAPPKAPANPESPVIDIGERPRNPDGTFAPFKQQVTAAAVAPPAPPPAPEPERPPQYLVEAARDFGLSDEEIFAMPVHVLHKTMFVAQQRMRVIQQQAARQATLQNGQVRNPEPQPAQDDLDFELNPEVLHPDLIPPLAKLRDQAKQFRNEIKELREENKQLRTRDEQRELNRAAAIYDAAFAGLGAEFESVIGKGAGREMDAKSAEYKRRIAILTEAGADPRIMTPGQVKARIKAAADMLYPRTAKAKQDAYAEVVEQPKNGVRRYTQQEWEQAGLQRPSARRVDDEPPSEAKAVRNLAAKMREQEDVIPDSEELDNFL